MDATTEAFVTEIVSRRIAENWLYWCLFLAASFLASFAGAYIKRRAENLATRDDFEELKRQLAQNTRVTEEIKSEIGYADWKSRELDVLKRQKLEFLMEAIAHSYDVLAVQVRKNCTGEIQDLEQVKLGRVEMLVSLYFPELEAQRSTYVQKCLSIATSTIERGLSYKTAKEQNRHVDASRILSESLQYTSTEYPKLLGLKYGLEKAAAKEMEKLLAG